MPTRLMQLTRNKHFLKDDPAFIIAKKTCVFDFRDESAKQQVVCKLQTTGVGGTFIFFV